MRLSCVCEIAVFLCLTMTSTHILVVAEAIDDQVMIRKVFDDVSLKVVATVSELQEIFPFELFDVIICVTEHPPLKILNVLLSLQEQTILQHGLVGVPIIVVAEFSDMDTIRRTINAGADDYIVKELVERHLRVAVETRLARRKSVHNITQQALKNVRQHLARVLPHEFRTPMISIAGGIKLLREHLHTLDKEEIQDILEIAGYGAQRLQLLMEKVLLYANLELLLEDNEIYEQLQETNTDNMQEIVEEVVINVLREFDIDKSRCKIIWLVPPASIVYINSFYLTKLLQEIVNNACRFSPPDSPILVKASVSQDRFILSVRDEGHGMSVEQVRQLGTFIQFDREYHEQQGIGIGWSIIKIIIKLFRGKFHVDSAPGKGTTVTIELVSVIPSSQDQETQTSLATQNHNEQSSYAISPQIASEII